MGLITNSGVGFIPNFYKEKEKYEKVINKTLSDEEFTRKFVDMRGGSGLSTTGTSIFDPVLTETMIAWFSKKGDKVIDPFAGGSVRGIVTALSSRQYTGIDLRQEQIDANIIQGADICSDNMPCWICGNSLHIKELAKGEYDFMLTCPPYGNLEVYSDDEADISNMSDDDFDKTYTQILINTVDMLKDNRFAIVVVGNYRDKKGYLRDLVGITVQAMEKAGAKYYNDFIIVTPNGSLPIRAGKAFQATRKMGRTHQYCLCFVKGNPKKAAERLGDVEIPDMTTFMEETEEPL